MIRNPHQTKRSSIQRKRRGLAVVELAICLPLLLLILVCTVESCAMMQLKQNMAIAAYEGARIGILPSSNSEAVYTQCQMLIDDRGIQGCTVTLDPPVFTNINVGDPLTVILTAEYSANSLFGGIFYEDRTVTESVVMLCE